MQQINRADLAEMDRLLASSNPLYRLPIGCDQQGRYPQAAEAATDIGAEEEPQREPMTPGEALFVCLLGLLSSLFVIGLAGYVWQVWFTGVA